MCRSMTTASGPSSSTSSIASSPSLAIPTTDNCGCSSTRVRRDSTKPRSSSTRTTLIRRSTGDLRSSDTRRDPNRSRPEWSVVLAVLYDLHGNTAALDPVLAEAETIGAVRYILGGDYGRSEEHTSELQSRVD